VVRFEFLVGEAVVLHRHARSHRTVTVDVVAGREKVAGQETPGLAVPVHPAATHSLTGKKRAPAAHRQRRLASVVAEGQRLARRGLDLLLAPVPTQLVLCDRGGKVVAGVAPPAALDGQHLQPVFRQFLREDRTRPAEADQYLVDGWKLAGHPVPPCLPPLRGWVQSVFHAARPARPTGSIEIGSPSWSR